MKDKFYGNLMCSSHLRLKLLRPCGLIVFRKNGWSKLYVSKTQPGLEVALHIHKSEAMSFYGRRNAPRYESQVTVGGVLGVGPTIKYLGLVLDSRWNFREHFQRFAPRLNHSGTYLKRLLPNVGGRNASTPHGPRRGGEPPCRTAAVGSRGESACQIVPVAREALRRGETPLPLQIAVSSGAISWRHGKSEYRNPVLGMTQSRQ